MITDTSSLSLWYKTILEKKRCDLKIQSLNIELDYKDEIIVFMGDSIQVLKNRVREGKDEVILVQEDCMKKEESCGKNTKRLKLQRNAALVLCGVLGGLLIF